MNRKINLKNSLNIPVRFQKLSFIITFIFLLIFPLALFATNYYVDADAPDGGDGSLSSPWNDLSDVENASLVAGDVVAFQRGDTWHDQLTISSGGAPGNPITFTAYGSGPKPIITARRHLVEEGDTGAWTNNGNNVWSTGKDNSPERLWLDGIEYLRTVSGVSNITSTIRWYYDTGTKILYVYATSNPGLAYSTIEGAVENDDIAWILNAIRLNAGSNYLSFKNLDLRGGTSAFYLKAAGNDLTLDSCIIGLYSDKGIVIESKSDNGVIKNCEIKSGYNFIYTDEEQGLEDGIVFWGGGNNWQIHDNYIANWGHTGISLEGVTNNVGLRFNEIYNNEFDGSNVSYMRAFEFYSDKEDSCSQNRFYYNRVHGMTSTSKLSGNNNEVFYNVFYNKREGFRDHDFEIKFVGSANYICHDNKMFNNTFHTTATSSRGHAVGIIRGSVPLISPIENNDIINNIFFSTQGLAFFVENTSDILNNTIKNNLVFSSDGSTNIIDYRSSALNAATFNTSDTNGDVVSGNIQGDPLFKDLAHGDLSLSNSTSPAVNAGLDVGLSLDFAGTQVPQSSAPDIGAYEFVNTTVGNIAGKVVDTRSGDPIPDVKITVTPGNYTATTDASGNYTIPDVPQGTYTVNASKANYLDDTATITVN